MKEFIIKFKPDNIYIIYAKDVLNIKQQSKLNINS